MSAQDSYALCRVFKKNGVGSEVEEQQQAQCSASLLMGSPQGLMSEYELVTTSPDAQIASSSCVDEEDKDDSWMQFITDDDAWYPSNTSMDGEDVTPVTF